MNDREETTARAEAYLNRQAELRERFFAGWRKLHPDVFTDDEWKYIHIYYDTMDVSTRWSMIESQDPGMLAAMEKFSKYRFYHLLQYVYAAEPETCDLEILCMFDIAPGEGGCFKLRVGPRICYFWRGQVRSEDDLRDEIAGLQEQMVMLTAAMLCNSPVDSL